MAAEVDEDAWKAIGNAMVPPNNPDETYAKSIREMWELKGYRLEEIALAIDVNNVINGTLFWSKADQLQTEVTTLSTGIFLAVYFNRLISISNQQFDHVKISRAEIQLKDHEMLLL